MIPKMAILLVVRRLARHRLLRPATSSLYSTQQVRGVHGPPWSNGNDPFRQMETFMRDMDRKLRCTIDSAMGRMRQSSEFMDECYRTRPMGSSTGPGVEAVRDVSTADTFKLIFSCPNAKPEDITITLNGNVLTVKLEVVTESEGTKTMQHLEHQQTLPEGVDTNNLESSLSSDGILSVFAPREVKDGSQKININRE